MNINPPPGIASIRHILRDADSDTPSLGVDGSMLEEMQRCPRASLFKHIYKRVRSSPKPELIFGQHIHSALEALAKGVSALTQDNLLELLYEETPMPEGDYRHLGRAKELLADYRVTYAEEQWQVVETEKPFSIVLGRISGVLEKPITIVWEGRADLKVRDEFGLWTVDYKTAKEFGDKYWNSYTGPSGSVTGYAWSTWRTLGEMPRGFIIRVLVARKPLERAPTARSAPRNEFHQRAFPIAPEAIKRWELNTLATVEDWLRHVTRGYYPQYDRKGFNCAWCQYLDLCAQPDERSARTLLDSGEFEDYTWSPLSKQNL